MYEEWDATRVWYHGSPLELTVLQVGSSITPDMEYARIFSHKPALVSISDDGAITHTGTQPGYLYRIAEPLVPTDIYPHPRTTLPPDKEWLTTRELRIELIMPTTVRPEELMSAEEFQQFRAQWER